MLSVFLIHIASLICLPDLSDSRSMTFALSQFIIWFLFSFSTHDSWHQFISSTFIGSYFILFCILGVLNDSVIFPINSTNYAVQKTEPANVAGKTIQFTISVIWIHPLRDRTFSRAIQPGNSQFTAGTKPNTSSRSHVTGKITGQVQRLAIIKINADTSSQVINNRLLQTNVCSLAASI